MRTDVDENDNTLTDLERYKDPNLFRLSRRIRRVSGALPAQAAGYLTIDIGGSKQKIPYFNP